MGEKIWFFIAWFCAFFLISVSLIIIIVYGIHFNNVKSALWVACLLLALVLQIMVLDPILILLTSIWQSYRTEKPPQDYGFRMEIKSREEYGLRRIKKHLDHLMYQFRHGKWKPNHIINPTYSKEMEELLLKYNEIFHDLVMFSFYILALLLIVSGSKDNMAYYSTRFVHDFLAAGKNVGPPTQWILTQDNFTEYLELMLMEKLHSVNFLENKSAKYVPGNIGPTTKVLGVARLRQHRLPLNHECFLRLDTANTQCTGYFDPLWRATDQYGVEWKPPIEFAYENEYWRILQPWKYKTAIESKTLPIFGVHRLYPGGGYTVNLGRNRNNTKHILNYILKSNWIDERTGVVFVELTLYCANANLFNIVTIVAEQHPFGTYSVFVQVKTAKLLFLFSRMHWPFWLAFTTFTLMIVLFTWRLIKRATYKESIAVHGLWNYVDVAIVLLSVTALVIFILRNTYISNLLHRLEDSKKNAYVSFDYAAMFDDCFSWFSAALVCISTIRLWKILHFALVFRVLSKSLYRSVKDLRMSIFIVAISLISLSTAMHLINDGNSARFSTFGKTFATLLAFTASLSEQVPSEELLHGGKCMGILFYTVQVIIVNIFLLNMLITITIVYFSELKKEMYAKEANKYTFWHFIKDEYYDFKDELVGSKHGRISAATESLRLRGGGGLCSRHIKKHSQSSTEAINAKWNNMKYTSEKTGLVNEIINTQIEYMNHYIERKLKLGKIKRERIHNKCKKFEENTRERELVRQNTVELEQDGGTEDSSETSGSKNSGNKVDNVKHNEYDNYSIRNI